MTHDTDAEMTSFTAMTDCGVGEQEESKEGNIGLASEAVGPGSAITTQ